MKIVSYVGIKITWLTSGLGNGTSSILQALTKEFCLVFSSLPANDSLPKTSLSASQERLEPQHTCMPHVFWGEAGRSWERQSRGPAAALSYFSTAQETRCPGQTPKYNPQLGQTKPRRELSQPSLTGLLFSLPFYF